MAMRRLQRWLSAAFWAALWAAGVALHPAIAAAQASHVSLVIDTQGVSLDARNATLSEILAAWSQLGGVKIVQGESLDSRRITLQLNNVREREALKTVLRDVAGYVLAARTADEDKGLSEFGTIVIIGSSSTAAAGRPSLAANPAPAFVVSQPLADAEDEDPAPARSPERPRAAAPRFGGLAIGSSDASGTQARVPSEEGAATPAIPLVVPETPIMRPSSEADPAHPFGKTQGADKPGTIVPGGPPPGFVYPPNTSGAMPGGTRPGATP